MSIIRQILRKDYNPASKIPKYLQIREAIRQLIESGHIAEEQMIPSELELCEVFDVSRMTVRQAMDALVREGILERRSGDGTFLKSLKLSGSMRGIRGFSEELVSSGLTSHISVVAKEIMKPNAELAKRLKITTNDKVIRVERVRYVDEYSLSHETSYLPYHLCRPLIDVDLSVHSLQQALTDDLGHVITHGTETVQTKQLDPHIAYLLKISPNQPCFFINRLLYTKKNQAIEYVETVVRGDKFMFVNDLQID